MVTLAFSAQAEQITKSSTRTWRYRGLAKGKIRESEKTPGTFLPPRLTDANSLMFRVERDIFPREIEWLYTEEVLKILGEYPSTWCAIVADDKEVSEPDYFVKGRR